jgi:hypothetical protein
VGPQVNFFIHIGEGKNDIAYMQAYKWFFLHSHMRRKEMKMHPWWTTSGLFTYVKKQNDW